MSLAACKSHAGETAKGHLQCAPTDVRLAPFRRTTSPLGLKNNNNVIPLQIP